MKISLLAVSGVLLFAPASLALQAIDDQYLANVSGQAGITIETNTSAADGTVLTAGSVVFTELDEDGLGDETVSLHGLKLQVVELDNAGNIIGPAGFKTTIDVLDTGELSLKTTDLPAISLNVDDIRFGSRSIGTVGLNKWRFAPGSFVETAVVPSSKDVKIRLRTFMTDGSDIEFSYIEDGLALASDIEFKPGLDSNGISSPFDTEFFVSAVDGELRLEFGKTVGTLELNNLRFLNPDDGSVLFGGATFGDVGFGNISVNTGYFTLGANPDAEGLKGKFASDISIGTAFYRTNGKRVNLENVSLSTGRDSSNAVREVDYSFEIVGGAGLYGNGIAASLSNIDDLSLVVDAITFSDADGSNAGKSLGSFGIRNLSLQGSLTASVWALPGAGSQGVRTDVQLSDGAQFNISVKDDPLPQSEGPGPDPELTASVVVNDFSSESHIDITEKGLHISVVDLEMSANLNSIKFGNNQNYKGQSGRVVIDSFTVQPGSYLRVEPIQ